MVTTTSYSTQSDHADFEFKRKWRPSCFFKLLSENLVETVQNLFNSASTKFRIVLQHHTEVSIV